ncbi:branched-chain amino acid:cation transporter, LIVCS family [Terribacillus aidingensis]|uniref:Branched-chain amino acid transport system carrier protein n=1 Tax=Terribacillus aidingensis TaxID=586416 RepID=A0A285N2C0_9BACI|nr:branched-chain amino acid transport system II carrier protein [Terribacillus aidingensis]SNZ03468.1 branched-chain amino acid:cation transporter, LIVCS family [Terribacillus aidingensis]
MSQKVPGKFTIMLGLMLFALFFGAGNLIFPPMLGQQAGENIWGANAGFLVTGVGLPLIGIIAFVFSGEKDLMSLSSRVHPVFGIVYTVLLYLAIGPFFAIPRAGNVSYEIGLKQPFLSADPGPLPLIVFSVIFFLITCLLSLNPTKIIDIIGKFLTPIKLTFIGLLVLVAILYPIGKMKEPTNEYRSNAFFNGFQEGYLTLDALVACVFGIIIVNAIKGKGITKKATVMKVCLLATGLAAVVLGVIYTSLAFMGASSVSELGYLNNGAEILADVSNHYFGAWGEIFLGLMITVACLTTSVGLITSCSAFFHELMPRISYRTFAVILAIFSAIVSTVGLTQLISISVPVLMAIYPITISLVFLTFLHSLFKGRRGVYIGSLALTFCVSIFDGLNEAGLQVAAVNDLYTKILPFHEVGLGWLVPSILGGLLGLFVSHLRK